MDVERLARDIDAELRALGSADRATRERAYLKSDLEHLGVAVPVLRGVARRVAAGHDLGHDDLVDLVRVLWDEPVHERRAVAVELLVAGRRRLGPDDLAMLERLLRGARTWALVDALAASVVGDVVERHPEAGGVLDRWAGDDDLWIRRAALLALLVPLRRGGGDFDRFGRCADAMLGDREPFIRKAIGWVLRDTGRRRPDLVFEWILPRAHRASGVTIREAVKPLSAAQRDAVLAAR